MHDHTIGMWPIPLLLATAYLLLLGRARRRTGARPSDPRRAAFFLLGCLLLGVALLPSVASFAHHDFRGHMVQHLLIGMYAPLALVLGAPVTVLLRALPATSARRVTGLLRTRAMRFAAHPVTALALSTGGMAVLYLTPLHALTEAHPVLHHLVHVHFLLSGALFAWAIAGPDPAPARPGVRARLVVLGVAIAAHAVVSQLMYGGYLVHVDAPIAQLRGAGEIMYYGGDIAELLLAAALVATWRPGRMLSRPPDLISAGRDRVPGAARLNPFRQP
ncbi:cytochrome c oxidase assembly protein [Herbidospora sp. NEAU-GS84]|uniref:Cytochrome c oxidase assembly protein n=1 Tax=Herbidospora solisilvae TaxID=2696284 RepID=A0A7C9J1T4_9ACTN|nr:cytochrome c oxidase assembly protein [Herbidospora solisilvae]NAS22107.1 cytochrome c oxidase assembly protein [Herbidospora solisilvae]